ncbi:MAG: bifunctional 4-hydroxy-3-methylbut-2-enyl diphosphate reductase/30S ribosomal protein S1, partial [Clostridia bacterium]|nr:bifunctional 4-hydroxy-3-methylbut-2-enyl diphosphate reductase/30S ribosomal protein S1 [Clostridia bacterium]
MNIIVARTAGFCFGVGRADKLINELLSQGKKVCTWGPLIHNPGYIEELKTRGVLIAQDISRIPPGYTVVIRTHGISGSERKMLTDAGFEIADATCPFVSKIHRIVEENTRNGETLVIAGDPLHPEVIGIRSCCAGESFVCNSFDEFRELFISPSFCEKKLILVAQTTFSVEEYEKYLNYAKKVCTNVKIFDTICSATSMRQAEAADIAKRCDAMIVVGGKNSSNTTKLYSICSAICPSYLVERADELDPAAFLGLGNVGVTAGASTPDGIIKEVRHFMSENIVENTANENEEMSFADALEESLNSMNNDQKVVGTVMSIQPNEIQVDIGRKQTGYIPIEEYSSDPNADPAAELKVGDKIGLIIMKTNDAEGTVMCSKRRYDATKYWEDVVAAFDSKEVLSGKVTDVLPKGVIVTYKGARIFIPASHSTVPRSGDLEVLRGQDVSFRVIDVDNGRRRAVGSIKSVVDEARAAASQKFWDEAFVGKVMTGTVKSLTSFAAFVDLGGVDGMIHRTEISWNRIKQPSDVLSVGDVVEVTIKKLDPENKKVSLTYRKAEDNPWEILKRDYPVGTVAEVKIVGLTAFGAFAQIFPGMDGLIHISQIADRRIGQPSDVLAVGDVVKAKITDIDFAKRRISLSIRALLDPKPESAEEAAPAEEEK